MIIMSIELSIVDRILEERKDAEFARNGGFSDVLYAECDRTEQ